MTRQQLSITDTDKAFKEWYYQHHFDLKYNPRIHEMTGNDKPKDVLTQFVKDTNINLTLKDLPYRLYSIDAIDDPFDQLKSYFDVVWDGEKRIETFLADAFHLRNTAYLQTVSLKMMINLAANATSRHHKDIMYYTNGDVYILIGNRNQEFLEQFIPKSLININDYHGKNRRQLQAHLVMSYDDCMFEQRDDRRIETLIIPRILKNYTGWGTDNSGIIFVDSPELGQVTTRATDRSLPINTMKHPLNKKLFTQTYIQQLWAEALYLRKALAKEGVSARMRWSYDMMKVFGIPEDSMHRIRISHWYTNEMDYNPIRAMLTHLLKDKINPLDTRYLALKSLQKKYFENSEQSFKLDDLLKDMANANKNQSNGPSLDYMAYLEDIVPESIQHSATSVLQKNQYIELNHKQQIWVHKNAL